MCRVGVCRVLVLESKMGLVVDVRVRVRVREEVVGE